jgi:hypothetical protein
MPPKGYKRTPEAIAKFKATLKAKRKAKEAGLTTPHAHAVNGKDASVYLRHAIAKWPAEKGRSRGIAKLYVQLALATLEGEA